MRPMDLAGLTKPYSGGSVIVTFFEDADQRLRQEVRQMRGHTDRSHTRSAAAVWDGEGLVQIEVHHVEAQVAGADDAKHGVHDSRRRHTSSRRSHAPTPSTFSMFSSKRPSVFGLVSIMPTTVSSQAASSALRSTLPRSV